jgi:hypothetical protein
MVRDKRIIADSIKDHLIPQVSSKNSPKQMFDALTKMHEGRNINQKMNLRTQLKNTKTQKGETVHDYFSRVSQFKEQLEAIGDVIHRVVQVGFEDEPPETEQSDAQKSVFTNSAGLSDHLFFAFPSLRGILINDLSMKVVKDYWPPKA